VSHVLHSSSKVTNLSVGSEAVGPHHHFRELFTSGSILHQYGVSYYLL
jgi:hypothetical protein